MTEDEELAAWFEAKRRRPITMAEELGHRVESDPPWGLTAVERWTCTACGEAVLRNRDVIYGNAAKDPCRTKASNG